MVGADPFFEKYEAHKRIGCGAFGSVLLVRRKGSSCYFAAKFVDPEVRKYGSDSQELRILQSLNHECVIGLTGVYGPHVPASSRQDPVYCIRLDTVLVFPVYDMDLKWLLRYRAACPEDFPEEHRSSICKDVFRGLEYLHGGGILHRDIKPANIFVRFGKVARAVIGDVGLGTILTSSLAAGESHTAHVCSDGYVPPELLQFRTNSYESVVYGPPVDVWSAGVVTFEVATMSSFLAPGAMSLEGIARRIGPSPPEYGRFGVGERGLEAWLRGHWLSIVRMCLDWQPQGRATAALLVSHFVCDTGTVPGTVVDAPAVCDELSLVKCSATASTAAASSAASTEIDSESTHYPTMTDRPVDLGPEFDVSESVLDLSGAKCQCSGNCGIRGHRRNRCQAVKTASSKLCRGCSCEWLFCERPRTWTAFCFKHSKIPNELSPTWRTVLAARQLNHVLVPCDVPSFIEYYSRHRCSLASVSVAAFVKEPAALENVEAEARRTGLNLQEAHEFRECWLKVIRKIGDGEEQQRSVEMRQLTRNGAGRVSGLGPTLASIGILKPSPDAGDADPDVRLGITRRGYSIRDEEESFHEFWKDFADESWTTALEAPSFVTFCGEVRCLLQRISKKSHVLRLSAEGYCFHFLYRKLLIGEARFRKRSTSFAAVDWHALTVGDLKYMSADQNDHLSAFESQTSAGAVSHFSSVESTGLYF